MQTEFSVQQRVQAPQPKNQKPAAGSDQAADWLLMDSDLKEDPDLWPLWDHSEPTL